MKIKIAESKKYENTQFDTIIYIKNRDYYCFVEFPNLQIVNKISKYELKTLLKSNDKNVIPWTKIPDGSYIKMNASSVDHFVILSNKIIRPIICIRFNNFDKEIKKRINKLKNKNFYIKYNDLYLRSIFYPLISISSFTSISILMYINKKLYIIPYGNSSSDGRICFGNNNFNNLDKEQLLSLFLNTKFNNDSRLLANVNLINHDIILDYDIISKKILNKESINEIDFLYYISQTEIDEFNYNIFRLYDMYNNDLKLLIEKIDVK